MLKNFTSKKIILAAIATLMALFSFFMLFFALYSADVGSYSENGFTWLASESMFIKIEPFTTVCFLLSLAELLVAFGMIGLAVYAFVKGKENLYHVIFVTTLISMLLYAISGFVTLLIMDSYYDTGSFSKLFTTYAYWPFIIGVLLTVSFYVLRAKLPEGMPINRDNGQKTFANNGAHRTYIVTSESESIDNISKYKTLLDQGIITQEEFDAKKKQLLGL